MLVWLPPGAGDQRDRACPLADVYQPQAIAVRDSHAALCARVRERDG
jgi:hypothetical protein